MKLHYPPDYVLDRMEWYEIESVINYQHYANKENWEQARLIAYIIAQVNSKKRLKIEDIIKFPWDSEFKEENQTISKEDIERLNKLAQTYTKKQ